MIDALVKIIIGIGALIFADAVTKEVTGKHIHEHVFDWWQKLRDAIQNWLHANKETLKIANVMVVVLDTCDDIAVHTKQIADQVTIGIYGLDRTKEHTYEIARDEVPLAEAFQQFPELQDKPVLIMEA